MGGGRVRGKYYINYLMSLSNEWQNRDKKRWKMVKNCWQIQGTVIYDWLSPEVTMNINKDDCVQL